MYCYKKELPMMSIIKRHFSPTFIAPKYDSLQYVMKISEVLLSCYGYTTYLLSVKTHSNHLISDTKGDSFIDNNILFNKLAFR